MNLEKFIDGIHAYLQKQLAPILQKLQDLEQRQPEKGEPGKDASPDMIREMVQQELCEIPPAKNGEDGQPGRDGLDVEIIDLDESKSYPRGTYATWNGGLLRSLRRTDPLEESPEKSGWHVIMNGIAGIELDQIDERNFAIRLQTTSGQPVEKKIRVPAIIDKGVWKSDRGYNKGDGVTYQGSFWIAQESTEDKPGSKDWRLAVKKGRDGKDGKGLKGDPGAPGRPGKDLTQMGPRGEKW